MPVKTDCLRKQGDKQRKTSQGPQIYRNQDGKVAQPKKVSIFEQHNQNPKEISAEIIKADCMNHGYRLDGTIGEGAYAKVKLAHILAGKLARNRNMSEIVEESGELKVAVKVIETRLVPREFMRKFLPREISNHANLPPNPHVVQIYEHFSTQEHVYVVMEHCEKGDLLELINSHIGQNQKGLGEELARKLFHQVCLGVQHIHNSGYVHRDLKCENILLDSNMNCKITDFGFSCQYDDKSVLLKTSCGSYAYTAPEVIKCKPYNGNFADIWSMGVILFAMVNGRLPFNDNQLNEMEEDMKMQRLKFERAASFECMVLNRKILQFVPSQRISLKEMLNDPWITGKKPIPRQRNKPEWINPYAVSKVQKDECRAIRTMAVNCSPQRATPPHAASRLPVEVPNNLSMVTINQDSKERVTLKSRKAINTYNKNIRTVSPEARRPNTWPKATRDMLSRKLDCSPGRTNSTEASNYEEIAYMLTRMQNDDPQAKIDLWKNKATGGKHIPNWFIQKLLQQSDQEKCSAGITVDSNTQLHTVTRVNAKDKKTVKDKADGESIRQAYRTYIEKLREKHAEANSRLRPDESSQYRMVSKPMSAKTAQNISKTPTSPPRASSRSPQGMQYNRPRTDQKKGAHGSGFVSRGVSPSRDWNRVGDSCRRSPAERSHDNREKLLKLYGKQMNCYTASQTLPPLLCQSWPVAIEDNTVQTRTAKSPTSGRGITKSARHQDCRTYQMKPVHKIVMHSCC